MKSKMKAEQDRDTIVSLRWGRGGGGVELLRIFTESVNVCTLKAYDAYLKKMILWMKADHYPNEIRFHLVTIVPILPFTSKLRSALHFRYLIVIPRFTPRADMSQS